jgi:hypothetical protein
LVHLWVFFLLTFLPVLCVLPEPWPFFVRMSTLTLFDWLVDGAQTKCYDICMFRRSLLCGIFLVACFKEGSSASCPAATFQSFNSVVGTLWRRCQVLLVLCLAASGVGVLLSSVNLRLPPNYLVYVWILKKVIGLLCSHSSGAAAANRSTIECPGRSGLGLGLGSRPIQFLETSWARS